MPVATFWAFNCQICLYLSISHHGRQAIARNHYSVWDTKRYYQGHEVYSEERKDSEIRGEEYMFYTPLISMIFGPETLLRDADRMETVKQCVYAAAQNSGLIFNSYIL